MRRIIIATLLALGVGCGDPASEAPEFGEDGQKCDPTMGPYEDQFVGAEGYDPNGCTLSERMAKVKAFGDDLDEQIMGPAVDDDLIGEMGATGPMLGTARQRITIGVGQGLKVSGGSSDHAAANPGYCDYNPMWTTAMPVIGNCLIPNGVSRMHWEVWPGYGSDVQFMRDRMLTAWSAWSRSVTCGGSTWTTALQAPASSEQPLITNEDDRYNTVAIPVYPVGDSPETNYGASTQVTEAITVAKTPIRNGIRYYGWNYLGIAVNHNVIEGFKQDACVALNDPQRANKLARAYEWILAHELGHVFGWPHLAQGIMRASNNTTCSDVFTTTAISGRLSVKERSLVNLMRDSSGLSITSSNLPSACQDAQGSGGSDRSDFL